MPDFWNVPTTQDRKPRRRLMAEHSMTGHEYPQPHIVSSPPGTQAPAHLINYTPDTNEVHAPGSVAPLDKLNYSLMPHDGLSSNGVGAGADYSGVMSPGAPPGPGTQPGMDTLTGRYGQQSSLRANTFSPGQPPLSPTPYGVGPGPRIQASGPAERPFDQRSTLQGNASSFGAGQEGRQGRDRAADFTGLDDGDATGGTDPSAGSSPRSDVRPGESPGRAGAAAARTTAGSDDAVGRAAMGGPAPAGFRFHIVREGGKPDGRPIYLWLINDSDPSRNQIMGWYDPAGIPDPRSGVPPYQNFDKETRELFSSKAASGKTSADFVVEDVHNYTTGLTEKRIFDKTDPFDKGRVIGNVAPDKPKEPPLSTPGGGRVVGTGAGTIVYRTRADGTEEVDQEATLEMRQAALDAEERKSEADILQAELDYDAAMGTATIFTTIEDADGQKYIMNSNTGSTMKLGSKDLSKRRVQLGNTLVMFDDQGQVKDTYTAPKDMVVDEFNGTTYQYDPRNPSGTMKELFKDPYWQPTEENKLAKSKADLATTLQALDKGEIDEMEARTRIEKDLFDLENIKPEMMGQGSFYLAPGAKMRIDYNENFGRGEKLVDTGPMDPRRRAAIDSMRAQLGKMGGDKKGAAEYLAMAEGLGRVDTAKKEPSGAPGGTADAAAPATDSAKPASGAAGWERADQEQGRTPAGNALAPEPGKTGTVSPDDPRYLGPRAAPEPAEEETVGEEITEPEPEPEPEPETATSRAGWKPRARPRAAAKPASTIVDYETPWHEQAYEAGIGGWKRANEEPDRSTPWYEQALAAGIGGWGAGQDEEASEYGNRRVEPPPETPGAFDWLPQLIGKTFKESQVQTSAPADIRDALTRASRDATNRTYPSVGPGGLGLIDPRFAPPEAKAEGLSSVLGRRRAPATPVAKVAEEASLWGPAPLQQYGAGADDDDTWWMEEEDRPRRYKPGQGPRQPRSNIDPKTGKPISRENMRKRPEDLEAPEPLRREPSRGGEGVLDEGKLRWDEGLKNFRDLYEAWKASAPPGHGVDIRQQRADEEARIGQMSGDELWRRADPVKAKLSEPEPGFNEEGVRDYTRDSPEFTRHHAGISEKYEDLVPAEEYLRHLEENRDPAELPPGRQRGQIGFESSREYQDMLREKRLERARRLREQRAPSPSRPSEPPELNDPDALADLVRPETQGALERERPGWERPGDPEDFPESLRRLGYSQEDLDESNPYTQWMQEEKKPEPTTWEELARLAPKDRPPVREEEPEVEWMNPGGWPEGGLNASSGILDLTRGFDQGPQILDIGKGHAPSPKLPMGPNIFTPPVQLPGGHQPGTAPELPKWLSNLGPDAIRALREKLGMGAGQGPGEMPPGGVPPTPPGGAPPPGGPMPPVPPQAVAGIGHRFGQPMNEGEPFHSGVDLQATEGTPTVAPEDGIVEEVRDDPAGLGLTVIVRDKNGMQHKLGHLSSTDAYRGMVVAKGQNLARVGSSGNTTGSHLHWAVRDKTGQPTDPTPALGDMGGLPPVPGTEMMGPPGGSGSPPGMAGPPTGAPPGAPPPGPQGAQGMPAPDAPPPGAIAKSLGMGQDNWWEPLLGAGHMANAKNPLGAGAEGGMGAGDDGEGYMGITPDQQADIDQENKRIDMEAENNRRDNETRRYIADQEHAARMKEIDQNWLIHQDDDRRQQEINAENTRHNQAQEQIERDRIQADITIQQMKDASAIKLQQMQQGNQIYMQQGEQAFQDWQNQQKMRMDILGSALKNPWLQKLSGMTPGPGYQGQAVGGQNISELIGQILQPYDPRAWGAQNAPSIAGLGGTTAGGPEGGLQTPGGGMFQQVGQPGGAAPGEQQAYMQGGQVYQAGQTPQAQGQQGYNMQTSQGSPDYMQWRGWDPFQRAAYRTNLEALGPGAWEQAGQQMGEQFAAAGGTPEVTRMQAAASDAAGRAGMEMTGELFGQTGEQFWQDQSKQWGQAKAPTVRQNLAGAQQTRY